MIRIKDKYRKSGIDTIGDIPWGTHMCQFYQTKDDLTETMVPYFKAGLENNEFCMWVTSEPLGVKDAKESLGKAVRDLGDYISKGQIEILDYSEWYTKLGKFNTEEVLHSWIEKEMKALEKGFGGLRLTGNTFWLGAKDWVDFREYEAIADSIIGEHRMIAICTYSLDKCEVSEVLDVMNNHETTLIKQKGLWRTVEGDERKRLKKVLSASEACFHRLFETAQDGILILDADTGQITEVNPFLKDMLGYTTEELVGKRLWEIGLFKDIAKSKDAFKKLLREGYIRYEDLQLETKDGKPVDVEFISNTYDVDHRKIIQCNIRDVHERKELEEVSEQHKILLEKLVEQHTGELEESNRMLKQELTERKQAEEALTQSERNYRELAESISDIFFAMNKELRYAYWNKASEKLTGISAKDALGKHLYDIFPDIEMTRSAEEMYLKVLRTKQPQHFTNEYQLGDKDFMFEINAYPSGDGVSAFVRDVTERKRVEEALREAEGKYRALMNNASDMILLADSEGNFLEANKKAEELLDYTKEELLHMTWTQICPKEELGRNLVALREIARKGSASLNNGLILRKDGRTVAVDITGSTIEYAGKKISQGIFRDITERKQAEEELKQSCEKLRSTLDDTVNALASLAEKRDPYTAGHQQRASQLAYAIAREMGLPEEQSEGLRVAGILHDIGKIYIPAEILSKPGKISEYEFDIIRTHPQVGYDIVKGIKFPWPVAQVISQHHERLDGSGYPDGLSGKEIILEAKILGVSDVVEAMTSHRPYRPALGIDEAIEEISQNRGILYDPEVVDACLKLFIAEGFKFE